MLIQTNRHKNIISECFVTKPEHIIVSKFNEDSYKLFAEQFNRMYNAGWEIIPIIIDSYGGGVNALKGMVSIIESSPVPVATIIESKAMSCGAILASCGTKGFRYMSSHASLMIHEVSTGDVGKVQDVKNSVEYASQLNEEIFEVLNRNCDKPVRFFQNKMKDRTNIDWFLGPKECKEFGIIDKIGVPTVEINLIQNVVLI